MQVLVVDDSAFQRLIEGMPAVAARAASGALVLPLGEIGRELDRRFPLATLSRFHE